MRGGRQRSGRWRDAACYSCRLPLSWQQSPCLTPARKGVALKHKSRHLVASPTNNLPSMRIPYIPCPPPQGLALIRKTKKGAVFSFTTEKAFVLNKIHDADGSVRWSAPVFMQGSSVGVGCSLGEEGAGGLRGVYGGRGWVGWVGGGRLCFGSGLCAGRAVAVLCVLVKWACELGAPGSMSGLRIDAGRQHAWRCWTPRPHITLPSCCHRPCASYTPIPLPHPTHLSPPHPTSPQPHTPPPQLT